VTVREPMCDRQPPNPRLQRTPLRAPLSRQPLGGLEPVLWRNLGESFN
jgi:hypothetical protein